MKLIFLILILICSATLGGCGNMRFESNERPEDKVIELEKLQESPTSRFQDYEIGDDVAIIRGDGVLDVSGRIEEVGGKIIYAAAPYLSRKGSEIWMPIGDARNVQGDEKTAPKGYKARTGEGRFIKTEWFPAVQIFPAPWTNAAKLKVGDTVYQNHFGDFKPEKGVITELPVNKSGSFTVRFDGRERADWVKKEDIFSSIEFAAAEKLSIGDIVYFDKMYWAMVTGKQDGKIIIRQAGFPAKDKLVDVSKLQILK